MGKYLRTVVVNFYCMDILDILWLLLWATVGFLAIYRRLPKTRWIRLALSGILLCWIGAAVYATIGDRTGGAGARIELIPFHSYRAVRNGGNPEIYRSNFMNGVLFYPAGLLAVLLLPEKWPRWCRCAAAAVLFAALSAGIEFAQFRFALGQCEIDDVIHNTAGAVAGAMAVCWLPPVLIRIVNGGKALWARYAAPKFQHGSETGGSETN